MTSVPDWIAAIGTAGATLLAGGALAAQQLDRRRQGAEMVTGWLRLREQQPIEFILANASQLPVYEVVAFAVFHPEIVQAVQVVTVLPPGEQRVQAGERWEPDHEDARYPPTVALLFRDAAGRSWRRSHTGELSRIRGGYDTMTEYLKEHPTIP